MKCDWCQDVNDLRRDKDETGASRKTHKHFLIAKFYSDNPTLCMEIVNTFLKNRKVTSYGQIVSRQYVTRLKSHVA